MKRGNVRNWPVLSLPFGGRGGLHSKPERGKALQNQSWRPRKRLPSARPEAPRSPPPSPSPFRFAQPPSPPRRERKPEPANASTNFKLDEARQRPRLACPLP